MNRNHILLGNEQINGINCICTGGVFMLIHHAVLTQDSYRNAVLESIHKITA